MTSLATPHHWEVNSAGIPKCCAIRTVMTWCSSGTVCSWDPRAFGNTACLSALLLTGSHSVHMCAFACVCLRTCACVCLAYLCPGQLQASLINGKNNYENWKNRNVRLTQRDKGQRGRVREHNRFMALHINGQAEKSKLAGVRENNCEHNRASSYVSTDGLQAEKYRQDKISGYFVAMTYKNLLQWIP